MVCMGRNLISQNTEGEVLTKLEPDYQRCHQPGIPLSSSSKLSESYLEIPYMYSSSQTRPKGKTLISH